MLDITSKGGHEWKRGNGRFLYSLTASKHALEEKVRGEEP
jgi:hypothetical protein